MLTGLMSSTILIHTVSFACLFCTCTGIKKNMDGSLHQAVRKVQEQKEAGMDQTHMITIKRRRNITHSSVNAKRLEAFEECSDRSEINMGRKTERRITNGKHAFVLHVKHDSKVRFRRPTVIHIKTHARLLQGDPSNTQQLTQLTTSCCIRSHGCTRPEGCHCNCASPYISADIHMT